MPPINLFKNSAINANNASAVTPQTASPKNVTPSPALTTASTTGASSYPAARPGAPAVPAPTAAAQRFTPAAIQPTPTTTSQQPFSPAPQPGAVPVPLSNSARPKSTIPPPPKAGESYILPSRTETVPPSHYPRQMYFPPPTTSYNPPSSSTSTSTVPLSSYPVSLPTSQYEQGAGQSLDGPPGYQQNPYASDLTLDQRRAQDAFVGDSDSSSTTGTTSLAEDAAGVWDTAKQWAQKVGEKTSELESEVWKRVSK